MCLLISKTRNSKRKYVYKVVDSNLRPIYYSYARQNDGSLRPIFYNLGETVISNRQFKTLTQAEQRASECNFGIHVYTLLKKALANLHLYAEKVVKCEVDPNDWIADGENSEAVYMKVKPIEVIK